MTITDQNTKPPMHPRCTPANLQNPPKSLFLLTPDETPDETPDAPDGFAKLLFLLPPMHPPKPPMKPSPYGGEARASLPRLEFGR